MAVGALEPQFYAALLAGLGLTDAGLPGQHDRDGWPELRRRFAATFAGRTRADWEQVFAGTDACVSPVLSLAEAPVHPHARSREAFVEVNGVTQPAPAPRFGRTAASQPAAPPRPGADTDDVLTGLGLSAAEVSGLRARGAVG
jgi:alpha-methylacyl-CoA racemase